MQQQPYTKMQPPYGERPLALAVESVVPSAGAASVQFPPIR